MLGTLDIEEAANTAAGNWQRFNSFVWWRERDIADADQWSIIYTSNRDSGLLAQSNATVIEKALEPFTEGDDPDVVMETHDHWAVGFVNGFSVRVFKGGTITEAFGKYHELAEAMDQYPILDESDYSERELEATIANIADAAWRLKNEFALPEDWTWQVYDWLSDHRGGEVENRDDQGGYPSEEVLKEAFEALGYAAAD